MQISFAHTAALVITNWWSGAIRQWWERLSVPDKKSAQAERDQDAVRKSQGEQQSMQPIRPSGNADLAELNSRLSADDMRSRFGQSIGTTRNTTGILCLLAAQEASAEAGDNWTSQGQKHIMHQSPGVDETELSRYLSSAWHCGLTEWRGVPLPGRNLSR